MTVEMAIWKMTPGGPVPLEFTSLAMEKDLEDMIVADPALAGMDLLVLGRQVGTSFGGSVDVLAVDVDAHVHVLELKRDRTPRDVVAQALDYGSWARGLGLEDLEAIYARSHNESFAEGFAARFGEALPDVINAQHELTVIASALDPASERIVSYLAETHAVPINVVFFRHFADNDTRYLARTWLLPPEEAEIKRPRPTGGAQVRPWNGQDFYVVLGNTEQGSDRWTIGARYGFVGAGGGAWYSKPLRNLAPGKRVFAYVGGSGYVGVGEVTGAVMPLRDLQCEIHGEVIEVASQPDIPDGIRTRAFSDDLETTEYAVPVRWLVQRAVGDAVSQRGLFASQVTVCKLRDERTIEVVSRELGIE